MTRPVAVLRPEPGNARTAAIIAAAGLVAIRLPLFAVVPVAWAVPDPAAHDALLLTSANAARHAGAGLARLRALPVLAVGAATAAAARDAGLRVALTGTGDAQDLVEAGRQAGFLRPLHLAGRDHRATGVATAIVYASDPVPVAQDALHTLGGTVALLHSARAARRLAAIVPDRSDIRLAAISGPVLAAASEGWDRAQAAARPTDAALLALARMLAD